MSARAWRVFVPLSIGILFGLAIAAPTAHAQSDWRVDTTAARPQVVFAEDLREALAVHYDSTRSRGYCVDVDRVAGGFSLTGIRLTSYDGTPRGLSIACHGGVFLRTHPDGDPNPTMQEMDALAASGAPFFIVQFGPAAFHLYGITRTANPAARSPAT